MDKHKEKIIMAKTLAEMLYERMEKRNVRQTDLCKGLCSTSAMSRYLHGERRIDRMLLTAFMQRLGMSPDKFTTLLTESEYYYFEWKQEVVLAQVLGDYKKVEFLLQNDIAKDRECNEILQEQFDLMLNGIVAKKLYGDNEKSEQLFYSAIKLTIPDFPEKLNIKTLFCMQEINAILLWLEVQSDKNKKLEMYEYLISYALRQYKDELELVKIYPRLAAGYLELLYDEKRYYECIAVSERAFELMLSTKFVPCISRILEFNVQSYIQLGLQDKIKDRAEQLKAWKEIMRDIANGIGNDGDELYLMDVWQETELFSEVISSARRKKGYSQENLSDGICTVETLSRIENGKRQPSESTYRAIVEKLDIKSDYYYGKIETDDYELLEMAHNISKQIINRKYDEASEMLEKLENKIDLSSDINRQYIENMRYSLMRKTQKMSNYERMDKLKNILSITVDNVPEKDDIRDWTLDFWEQYFTVEEISIMIKMSDVLLEDKDYTQATYLLENLLNYYKRSKVNPEFHYRTVILITARLTSVYGHIEKYEKQREYLIMSVKLAMVCNTINNFPAFLNNLAHSYEKEMDDRAVRYYYLAYQCADLFDMEYYSVISKKCYDKLLKND